jgi:hypothetical protein
MFRRLRPRLTYANIVSTLCLFIVLGGTAYAAATIGSAQVIDESLQSVDLKNNAAVRSADVVNDNVANGGLAGLDIRANTVTGADVDESSLGKVPNADKVDGIDSSQLSRSSDYRVGKPSSQAKDVNDDSSCEANESCYIEVECDPGDLLKSGGHRSATPGTFIETSEPDLFGTWRWIIIYRNDASKETELLGLALCTDQAAPFGS